MIVIILFLQSWRAAIIPIVAIPVSLIGTFFVMAAFGFSLNNLTLFGLVLAIGIVVDDAIVVVENVERYLRQGLSPRDAAHKTMDEVGGALIAIALVLCAVFIPTAFITGISGAFYRQFALTIAASTIISAIVSLTLSPALAALLLRPHGHEREARVLEDREPAVQPVLLPASTRVFDKLSLGLCRADAAGPARVGAHAGRLCRADRPDLFRVQPHAVGLHPAARSRLFHHRDHLAAGRRASSAPTASCARRRTSCCRGPAWRNAVAFAGFDGATFTNAPNSGVIFVTLEAVRGAGEGRAHDRRPS